MSSSYTEIRSQSTQVDIGATAEIPTHTEDTYSGRIWFDATTGYLYLHDANGWIYLTLVTVSTSTSTSTSISTSTTSTSTTSTSTSTTSSSTSTTSSSTSTTIL